jgi:putative heme iron utilization protein
MDLESERKLINLLGTQRTAALATTHSGEPNNSMVLFAPYPDFSALIIHTSRLSQHTRDMLADPRVSLLIAQSDLGEQDPQTLARIAIQGEAQPIPTSDPDYARAARIYLDKFPLAQPLFSLADFTLFRILPLRARYVAGFARAFNLTPASLRNIFSSRN